MNKVALFLALVSTVTFSSEDEMKRVNEIIDLICQYSHVNGEYNGVNSKKIRDDVYDILFKVEDSVISVNDKIELLHIMILFQRYSTDAFRSVVLDKYSKEGVEVSNQPLLIMPLLFSAHCDLKIVRSFIEGNDIAIMTKNNDLTEDYKDYYKKAWGYLVEYEKSKGGLELPFRGLLETRFLNNPSFNKKYPIVKLLRKCPGPE